MKKLKTIQLVPTYKILQLLQLQFKQDLPTKDTFFILIFLNKVVYDTKNENQNIAYRYYYSTGSTIKIFQLQLQEPSRTILI